MYRLTKQIGDPLAEGRGGQGLSQAFTDEIFQYLEFQKKFPRKISNGSNVGIGTLTSWDGHSLR